MLDGLLIQLFWLSFGLVGYGVYRTLFRNRTWRIPLQSFHWISALLILYALGFVSMLPVIVPGYLLHCSIYLVAMWYSLLLIYSLGIALRQFHLPPTVFTFLSSWKKWLIVAIPLVVGYILAYKWEGSLGYDSPVHVAKINQFIGGHLTLSDPYFGNNGVSDPRYSLALMHILQATIATLTGVSAIFVWEHSYPFYSLMLSAALFTLCWEFAPKNIRPSVAYSALATSWLLYLDYFNAVLVPNRIVFVWVVLCIVGLLHALSQRGTSLLLIATLLVAATHPISALGLIILITLVSFVQFMNRTIDKRLTIQFLLAILILMLPVLLQLHYPNNIVHDPAAFTPPKQIDNNLEITHIGHLAIGKFHSPATLLQFLIYGAMLLLVILEKRITHPVIKISVFALLIVAEFLGFNRVLLIFIGYIWLIIKAPSQSIRIILLCLGALYPLLVYNPIFMTIIETHEPLWLISRLQDINVIGLISLFVGLYVIHSAYVPRNLYRYTPALLIIVSLGVYAVHRPTLPTDSYIRASTDQLKPFAGGLSGQVLASDNATDLYYAPMVSKVNVVSISSNPNASLMTDLPKRQHCLNLINRDFDPGLLYASGATVLLVKDDNPAFKRSLIQHAGYFKPIQSNNGMTLYKFSRSQQLASCTIPYGR